MWTGIGIILAGIVVGIFIGMWIVGREKPDRDDISRHTGDSSITEDDDEFWR